MSDHLPPPAPADLRADGVTGARADTNAEGPVPDAEPVTGIVVTSPSRTLVVRRPGRAELIGRWRELAAHPAVLAGVAVGTTVAVEALALVARRLAGPAAAPRAVELHGTFTHHVLHHHVVHHVVHVVDLPSRRSPTAS